MKNYNFEVTFEILSGFVAITKFTCNLFELSKTLQILDTYRIIDIKQSEMIDVTP
jgi:hypothetical protein